MPQPGGKPIAPVSPQVPTFLPGPTGQDIPATAAAGTYLAVVRADSRRDRRPEPTAEAVAPPSPDPGHPAHAPRVVSPRAGEERAAPVADQVAQAILGNAEVVRREGRTEVHLRLEPPELGPVRIHLTATEHTVSARLVVQDEVARQLIESQVQSLKQRLAEAGLSLGQFDVSQGGGGTAGQDRRAAYQPPVVAWYPEPRGSESPDTGRDDVRRRMGLIDVMA